MTGVIGEARFAARALWRHRGFTLAVVLALGVGFGATIAVFSIYRAALARSLPIAEPDRLVFLHRFETNRGYYSSASYPAFEDYRSRAADVLELAAYATDTVVFARSGSRRLTAAMVTSEYFKVAGVSPVRGRLLARDDRAAAVIGERLWTEAFGRDPSVIGSAIALDGRTVTIVGVLPASFTGFDAALAVHVWLPLEWQESFDASAAQRGRDWLEIAGRLRPDVGLEQARAALTAVGLALAWEYPETEASWRLQLTPGASGNIYPHQRAKTVSFLSAIGAAALLLLFVTAATAGNLAMARMQTRATELRIRLAIGAGRRHLLRLVLIEHAILAAGAAAAGGLLAAWIPGVCAGFVLPGSMPISDLPVSVDSAQGWLAATLCGSLTLALTALTAPTWSRAGAGRIVEDARARRLLLRRALVAGQIALSLALVAGGALLFKSLRGQIALDGGFRAQPVLMATIDLPAGENGHGAALLDSIRTRVAAAPGVTSAAWSFIVPYGARRMQTTMTPLGGAGDGDPTSFVANTVGAGYFRTMGIPVLRGRAFAPADREGTERVVVVTESLAARYWPGRDPIGQRLASGTAGVRWTIVGVVPDGIPCDIRTLRGGDREHVFFPLAQAYGRHVQMIAGAITLLVRTEGNPLALAGHVRGVVHEQAPAAVPVISTSRRHVDRALSQEWLAATAGGSIAGLALALAALGLYGVVRYTATGRTREFAIHLALGATPRDVVGLTLRGTLWMLVPGGALGLAGAAALGVLLRPLLHDVQPLDSAVLGIAFTFTAVIVLAAAWLPARAAARMDPSEALRLGSMA